MHDELLVARGLGKTCCAMSLRMFSIRPFSSDENFDWETEMQLSELHREALQLETEEPSSSSAAHDQNDDQAQAEPALPPSYALPSELDDAMPLHSPPRYGDTSSSSNEDDDLPPGDPTADAASPSQRGWATAQWTTAAGPAAYYLPSF